MDTVAEASFSVLYRDPGAGVDEATPRPACFVDLHLDQIVDAIAKPAEAYRLAPFFHAPLASVEDIAYRQAVMRDLAQADLVRAIQAFADGMRMVRACQQHADECHYPYEARRWLLAAGETYCGTVRALAQGVEPLGLASTGLCRMRDHLQAYLGSSEFLRLEQDVDDTLAGLRGIRYTVLFKDGVTVRRYDGEPDYSEVVTALFAKFRQAAATDYLAHFPVHDRLNHVEAMILERVALLFPGEFGRLDAYVAGHADFVDPSMLRFDREVQFYLAYRAYIEPLKRLGFAFCYPEVSESRKDIHVEQAFDLALAAARRDSPRQVVRNDVALRDQERILVVTGPNHGGKTTYARMVGQLHYLACLGLPVPGANARLFLFDRMFTHFERSEDVGTLRGKLQDDLVRIHAILAAATPRSVIIMNEIFSSTSLEDAVFLSERVMAAISDKDAIAVCVTFLVELTVFDDKTVSMVGAIDPQDPSVHTFRIERRPADGLAYALAVAEKHRVTHDWLLKRIAP